MRRRRFLSLRTGDRGCRPCRSAAGSAREQGGEPAWSCRCQGDPRSLRSALIPWAAEHVGDVAVIFLADVFIHLFVGLPCEIPATGPGGSVGSGVVDGRFVTNRIVI